MVTTHKKRLPKATRDRIFKLLASGKLGYKDIATRCKVSLATISRMKKEVPTPKASA